MTDKEILDRLWEAYRETPFASFVLQRKLDLQKDEYLDALNLLNDMADSEDVRNGYRIKRVASTVYKLIKTQHKDSDTAKGKPLTEVKESLTGEIREGFPSDDTENEPLERFSFFPRGDQSKASKHAGDIKQLHHKLTADTGWKLKIENIRSLTGEAQAKAKAGLPAFTPSVLLTSGKRTGVFVHTNLIQADFDEAEDFTRLFDALCADPHARLVFRSPRGKVKALIKVANVQTNHEHTAAFEAVSSHCKAQRYGEIDNKPKNINCLCFISHDPLATLKNAVPLEWVLPEPPPQRPLSDADDSSYDGEPVDLTSWLKLHDVTIHETRNHNGNLMYLVDCPWSEQHTQDFGHKDTAVFVDPTDGKWCFNCFHDHCELQSWEDYRQAVAPQEAYTPPRRKPLSKSKRRLNRDRQLYGRKR